MADVAKLVPIIIKWEAGVNWKDEENRGLDNEQLFEKARAKGFGNDPADSGGATMVGVTIATYKAYRKAHKRNVPTVKDLKAITYAEWLDILKTMFWDRMKADEIRNQSIANLCVNTVWGSGPGYIKTIQGVLGCRQDGIVGPVTLGKINGWNPQSALFEKLWCRRKKFFEDIVARSVADYERKVGRKATLTEQLRCTKKRFLNGWLNRLNDFKFVQ